MSCIWPYKLRESWVALIIVSDQAWLFSRARLTACAKLASGVHLPRTPSACRPLPSTLVTLWLSAWCTGAHAQWWVASLCAPVQVSVACPYALALAGLYARCVSFASSMPVCRPCTRPGPIGARLWIQPCQCSRAKVLTRGLYVSLIKFLWICFKCCDLNHIDECIVKHIWIISPYLNLS